MSSEKLGNLVRFEPLSITSLPYHPGLVEQSTSGLRSSDADQDPQGLNAERPNETSDGQSSAAALGNRPDLLSFIEEVFGQAERFTEDLHRSPSDPTEKAPARTWVAKSPKNNSNTTIHIYQRRVKQPELVQIQWGAGPTPRPIPEPKSKGIKGETWSARVSEHEDSQSKGTATFLEFVAGLKKEHAAHEQEYTPDISETYKVLQWEIPSTAKVGKYYDLEMSIHEMCHKLPNPLGNRVFPVLVISAMSSEDSFIDVQIGLRGLDGVPGSRHVKRQEMVHGTYTSIERGSTRDGHILWSMATVGDVGGNVPSWMQELLIPAAIANDVRLFFGWAEKYRANRLGSSSKVTGSG